MPEGALGQAGQVHDEGQQWLSSKRQGEAGRFIVLRVDARHVANCDGLLGSRVRRFVVPYELGTLSLEPRQDKSCCIALKPVPGASWKDRVELLLKKLSTSEGAVLIEVIFGTSSSKLAAVAGILVSKRVDPAVHPGVARRPPAAAGSGTSNRVAHMALRVALGHRELKDGKRFVDYHIRTGCTVQLSLALRGGGPAAGGLLMMLAAVLRIFLLLVAQERGGRLHEALWVWWTRI